MMTVLREILSCVLILAVGYLIGSIPWGLLIGKFNGLDIRKHGSGNIGATNVRRVLGRDWGIACFVLDFFKGLVPVLICARIGAATATGAEVGRLLAAGAAVVGHVFPLWLNFKGGKGVATTIGALIAVAPSSVILALLTWFAIFKMSRYVSLASLSAAIMLPLSNVLISLIRGTGVLSPTLILLLVLAVLIIVRHRGNIQRLRDGTEHRFERKKSA